MFWTAHHHHHHHVACPEADIAVPTSLLHACRFCARWSAVARPMLRGARSDSTVRSQVWRGRPARRFQSLGKGATLALRTRLWSMDGSARAIWPKYLRRVVWMVSVSGGWSVRWRTSSLEMRFLQDIPSIRCRHHWSKASRLLTSCRVGDHEQLTVVKSMIS